MSATCTVTKSDQSTLFKARTKSGFFNSFFYPYFCTLPLSHTSKSYSCTQLHANTSYSLHTLHKHVLLVHTTSHKTHQTNMLYSAHSLTRTCHLWVRCCWWLGAGEHSCQRVSFWVHPAAAATKHSNAAIYCMLCHLTHKIKHGSRKSLFLFECYCNEYKELITYQSVLVWVKFWSRTQQSVSVWAKSLSRTQQSVSVWVKSLSRTQQSVSVWVKSLSRTQQSVSVWAKSLSRTQQSVSVWVKSLSRTQQSVSVWVKSLSRTQQSVSVLVKSWSRTQQSVSVWVQSRSRTQQSVSVWVQSQSRTQQSVSVWMKSLTRTHPLIICFNGVVCVSWILGFL